jgi:hypothetical protein
MENLSGRQQESGQTGELLKVPIDKRNQEIEISMFMEILDRKEYIQAKMA